MAQFVVSKIWVSGNFLQNWSLKVLNFCMLDRGEYGPSFEFCFMFGQNPNAGLLGVLNRNEALFRSF